MENSTRRKRLKSRHILTHHAPQLVYPFPARQTVNHWTHARLCRGHQADTSQIHAHHQTADMVWAYPDESVPDYKGNGKVLVGLAQTCCAADCLKSDSCDCGAEQTADHITGGRCPICRPPEGIQGHIGQALNTRPWLDDTGFDI